MRFGPPLRMAAVALSALVACALPAGASAAVAGSGDATPPADAHGLGLLYERQATPSAQAIARVEAAAAALPTSVDLTAKAMPVGNQGPVGSCAAWATDYGALGYWENAQGIAGGGLEPMYTYSQYVNAYDGGQDAGSSIDYHLQVAEQQGVDNQADYTQGNFDYWDLPTSAERAHAVNWKLTTYSALALQQSSSSTVTQQAIEGALAAGNPVVIGIPVYYNFWVGNGLSPTNGGYYTGVGDTTLEGNHAIVALGYDSTGLRIENSWGTGWADHGYARLAWSWVNQHVFEALSVGPLVSSGTPVNVTAPAISGDGVIGHTLTTSTGSWNPAATTYAYQWQRAASGSSSWSNISGATSSTYTPVSTDASMNVRVVVTGTNSTGSATAASAAVGPIHTTAPANTATPAITGVARQGMTLTASPGSWNPAATSYAYQWQRSGDAGATWASISGATAATYVPGTSDLAVRLRVQVTATNSGGSASAASGAVGPVASGAPVNTALPGLSGGTRQGQTLTASLGSWSPAGTSYGYQWQRSTNSGSTWTSVAGATGPSYVLTSGDVHALVRVQVHAVNAYGDRLAASQAAGPVASGPPASVSLPTISGSAVRGATLTASAGSWNPAGTAYGYHWQRSSTAPGGWENIAGATAPTFTIPTTVKQLRLRVIVTAVNPDGSASAASGATAPVQASRPANTAPPTVSGAAKTGSTLSAKPGTWLGFGNAYTYQWQRNVGHGWTNVAGGTRSTYTVGTADRGATIRVVVTAANPDGTARATNTGTLSVPKVSVSVRKGTRSVSKGGRRVRGAARSVGKP